MTRLVLAVAAFALLSSAPYAASPPPLTFDFSRTKCEDPKVIDFIKATLSHMTSADGRHSLSEILGNNSNLKARTLSAQKKRLDCRISVATTLNGRSSLTGKFSILQKPNGTWVTQFDPLY